MRIVQIIMPGEGDCCGPESQQPRAHEMAVQVPHRTEVKLIAAIVEKHPKVRFAVSCTSAYADLYDRMEQALRCVWPTRWRSSAPTSAPRFLSTPVQTSWVWRFRDSSGGGASCPKKQMQKTSASCRPIGKKRSSFLNALHGGESASYVSALLASSAAPRIPWSPPQPGAQM